ncbi:aspartate/glutamate racemase family protein [Embleya sp. AB8]|uniref:aspartate/glutamate racemase family protein n=1 Tax=Embleya sp. AB8 TaxID=3156304 RepID=UPI003C79655E
MNPLDRPPRRLGILGGMGPLATADFYRRLVERTPAGSDQEHVPVAMWADPRVPDRTAALLGEGPSPVPALVEGARWLRSAGAECIAIPCNTAHAYVAEIALVTDVEVLDMVSAALVSAGTMAAQVTRVGVLCTRGTRVARLYERAGEALGITVIRIPLAAQERLVDPAIRAVKQGLPLDEPSRLIAGAAEILRAGGAQVAIAACTEIPLISREAARVLPLVDSTTSLVDAVLARLDRDAPARAAPGWTRSMWPPG